MSRAHLALVLTVALLFWPAHASAQLKDSFAHALVEFANTANADDNGAAVSAAIDAMAQGLVAWDAALARTESGLAAEVGSASPSAAARMRTVLGAAYLERGRTDDALKQFDAAVLLDPSFANAWVLKGIALESANRSTDAAAAYLAAWRRQPGDGASAYRVLRLAGGGNASVVTEVAKALSDDVERGATGGDRSTVGFADARLLDEGSISAPVFVPAAFNDGVSLMMQRRYEQAIASFKTAVSASVDAVRDEHQHVTAASARIASQDLVAARGALGEAVLAFPSSGLLQWMLGRLQLALGDDASALRSFQTAATLPLLGGAANVYTAIGRLQHNQLDLDGAVSTYSRRVDLTPNDVAAHIDLGDVYRAQDRLDEALAEYSIASLLDGTNVRALATAAQIHAAAGRDASAVNLLRRAVLLEPLHLEARYALSRALLRLGQDGDARRQLEVFEQLQQKALQDQRRQFEENQIRIDDTLKRTERPEPGR